MHSLLVFISFSNTKKNYIRQSLLACIRKKEHIWFFSLFSEQKMIIIRQRSNLECNVMVVNYWLNLTIICFFCNNIHFIYRVHLCKHLAWNSWCIVSFSQTIVKSNFGLKMTKATCSSTDFFSDRCYLQGSKIILPEWGSGFSDRKSEITVSS